MSSLAATRLIETLTTTKFEGPETKSLSGSPRRPRRGGNPRSDPVAGEVIHAPTPGREGDPCSDPLAGEMNRDLTPLPVW